MNTANSISCDVKSRNLYHFLNSFSFNNYKNFYDTQCFEKVSLDKLFNNKILNQLIIVNKKLTKTELVNISIGTYLYSFKMDRLINSHIRGQNFELECKFFKKFILDDYNDNDFFYSTINNIEIDILDKHFKYIYFLKMLLGPKENILFYDDENLLLTTLVEKEINLLQRAARNFMLLKDKFIFRTEYYYKQIPENFEDVIKNWTNKNEFLSTAYSIFTSMLYVYNQINERSKKNNEEYKMCVYVIETKTNIPVIPTSNILSIQDEDEIVLSINKNSNVTNRQNVYFKIEKIYTGDLAEKYLDELLSPSKENTADFFNNLKRIFLSMEIPIVKLNVATL